jgi:hypothetical protein
MRRAPSSTDDAALEEQRPDQDRAEDDEMAAGMSPPSALAQ